MSRFFRFNGFAPDAYWNEADVGGEAVVGHIYELYHYRTYERLGDDVELYHPDGMTFRVDIGDVTEVFSLVEGDKVTVLLYPSDWCGTIHNFQQGTVVEYVSTDPTYVNSHIVRGPIDGIERLQYVPNKCLSVSPEDFESFESNEEEKYTLFTATVLTDDGLPVTIKRSRCRHYYIKRMGQTQRRVSRAEVEALLAGALS